MREHLISALVALVAAVGYFLLLDFARPALESKGLVAVWWVILTFYAMLIFGVGFIRAIRTRPKLSGIGFVILVATLFLYDPTINVHLKRVGLGWLWIASLTLGFAWLLALMRVTVKDRQREMVAGTSRNRST